jgi:hypothetical protein
MLVRLAAQTGGRHRMSDYTAIFETGTPPLPMDMAAVEKCEEWLEQNHVDLSKALVTMISLAV